MIDYITKKEVKDTPEESVRQEYAKVLHEELKYPKECMDIEVTITMGSSKKKADICIYEDEKRKKIIGIVELKSNDNKLNLKQLKSYMSATSSCRWGVCTNGTEYKYAKRINDEILFPDHFIIPKWGEEVSKIKNVDDLLSPRFLKRIFKSINYNLYANTNLTKSSKQGAEMIKIIFCKLFDEKEKNIPLEFQVREYEENNPEGTKERITKNLWSKLKNSPYASKGGIFEKDEVLELDARSLVDVIKELQRYRLEYAPKDVIGEAFEVFAEKQFAGEKGQFFTPRTVVDMCVKIIDPKIRERILDPACGSGGFLINALDYILKDEKNTTTRKMISENYFFGFDKDIDLVKICKLYMVLMGDGNCNIKRADSLKERGEKNDNPNGLIDHHNNIIGRAYDVILTNPPFGSKIKIQHDTVLRNFDLGHKWEISESGNTTKKTKHTPPQILFLELCYRLLADEGRLAIVLPEGIFGNPTTKDIRKWMFNHFNIIGIVDCPNSTFMPYTGTKTCVAFLVKKKTTSCSDNREIFFAIAENSGHSMRGDEICDNGILREDFTKIVKNYFNRKNNDEDHLGFFIPQRDLDNMILVPRYYDPRIKKEIKELEANMDFKTIKELIEDKKIEVCNISKTPNSKDLEENEEYRYVRTADIYNLEINKNTKQNISEKVYNRFHKQQDLQKHDILFVKDGDIKIGNIAMINENDKFLVHGHFYKIRATGMNPFLLFYSLNSKIVKKQIRQRVFIQSTLGTIGNRICDLKLPFYKKEKEKEIIEKTKKILENRDNLLNYFCEKKD